MNKVNKKLGDRAVQGKKSVVDIESWHVDRDGEETESDEDRSNTQHEHSVAWLHAKHKRIVDLIQSQNKHPETIVFKINSITLSRDLLHNAFKRGGEVSMEVCFH